jgi:hypothetical protein
MPDSSSRISVEETARRLGLSPDEVIAMRRRGKIRGYPDYGNWVFEEDDVAQLAEKSGRELASDSPTPTPTPTAPAERLADPQVEVVPLSELIKSDSPITSAQLIASLASRHGTGFQDTANVVDGFWHHLLDSDHYHQGRRSLVMPHFGTFSLKRTHDGQTELRFQSQPLSVLRLHRSSSGPHRPSTKWIEHWQQHPPSQQRIQRLSLKRKLAVAIDQDIDLDLQTTFLILWDLIETITAIMARGQSDIRWAKRGVMKHQPNTSTAHYSFRTYKRLTDRLPALSEPTRNRRPRRQAGSDSKHINSELIISLPKVAVLALVALVVACCGGFALFN